ncbi:MAG: hypothetical protein ACI30X_01340 [Muribaculaceae bacterium]
MKDILNQIVQSIEQKRDILKDKTEKYFASINIPSINTLPQKSSVNKSKSIPPISYILYGVSGLSVVGAIASDSKLLCLVAAASAFGGYALSNSGVTNRRQPNSIKVNIEAIKTGVVSKVLDSVKMITHEWEEFMEFKQKEIQSAISQSSLSESDKDSLLAKTFIYEVIDVSISEFTSIASKAIDVVRLKQSIQLYMEKVKSAIDKAANIQISKYKSITL